jgi:hypothetical protein
MRRWSSEEQKRPQKSLEKCGLIIHLKACAM